jgi:predicted ABC-type ATPase
MPNLYIIAGCNGAGKTTASYTVLPELFNCREFVNADTIASQISPDDPESAALEAGRIMLVRINDLLAKGIDFALETTLSTRSYVSFIKKAKTLDYEVTLLYFWLSSPQIAISRVAKRVSGGGHHIPDDVVMRRYYRGIKNLVHLYIPVCDNWIVNNNMNQSETVAKGSVETGEKIVNEDIWNIIKSQSNDSQ